MADVQLRRMVAADLPAAHALTQAVHWSHRLEDWQFHFTLGKGWVAVDAAGTVLGTIIWWAWGEHAATLGLVVVNAAAQGRGIGRLLMNVVLKDAGPRAFQLMATDAGLKLYEQCGFIARGRVEQRQAVPMPIAPPPVALPALASGLLLRDCAAADVPAIVQLDALAFGAPRAAMLAAVLREGSGCIVQRGGLPVGFALLRRAGHGLLIGPLVAEEEDQAIGLVARLLQSNPGFMRIDVPTSAARLCAWLDTAGVVTVDRVTPMVRSVWPSITSNATAVSRFGLASQALG